MYKQQYRVVGYPGFDGNFWHYVVLHKRKKFILMVRGSRIPGILLRKRRMKHLNLYPYRRHRG